MTSHAPSASADFVTLRQRRSERGSRKPAQDALLWSVTLLGAGAAFAPATQAATFTVSNLNDSGAGSLRQAITDANGTSGADVITFQAGLSGTITLTSGQLSIDDSVDIQGPGAATLTVSGNNASRVFYLYAAENTIDVSISGLTVTGGNANIGAGIIDYDENLTLDHVVVTGNTTSGDGGGLWADGFNMHLAIRHSTISGNTAGDDGGGIYVEDTGGPLLIQDSTITGNHAAGSGGGIYFYDPDDVVSIERTTISGNTADGVGGGIYLYDTDGSAPPMGNPTASGKAALVGGGVSIDSSTISGNTASAGGGLFFYGPDHAVEIISSTVSGNQATAGGGGGAFFYFPYAGVAVRHSTISGNSASGTGGGIYVDVTRPVIDHTIVADNAAGADADLANGGDGGFEVDYSLIESSGGASIDDLGGNVFGQDPQLGSLADNGGPTQTQLPAGTSPAVNTGDPAYAGSASADQRSNTRIVNGRIDIGAAELAPGTIALTASGASVAENAGSLVFTAQRTGGSDGAISTDYASADGTALAGQDYIATSGTLSWASGDTAPKTFSVPIVDDVAVEPNETFVVALSKPTNGAILGTPASATATIVSDDAASSVQFQVGAVSVNESAGTVTLTVTRSGAPAPTGPNAPNAVGMLSVDYATAAGSAQSGSDFTPVSGTLTWVPGDYGSRTITVPIVNDATPEPAETFTVQLSNPQGLTLGAQASATVTISPQAATAVTPVPGLEGTGRTLLGGALAALAALGLRRRRSGLPGLLLAASLPLLGLSGPADAAGKHPAPAKRSFTATTVTSIERSASRARIVLGDASVIDAPESSLEIRDHRRGHKAAKAGVAALAGGQIVIVKRKTEGKNEKIVLKIFDTAADAQKALARRH